MKKALALAACFPCCSRRPLRRLQRTGANAGELPRGPGDDRRGGVVRDSRLRPEGAVERDLHFVALRSNDTGLVGGF